MIPQSQSATALELDLVTLQVQAASEPRVAESHELTGIYLAQKAAGQAEVVLNGHMTAE